MSTASSSPPAVNLLRVLLFSVAGWTLVYLLVALDTYLVGRRFSPILFQDLFAEQILWIVIWCALTPWVVWNYRRHPLGRGRPGAIWRHVFLSLAVTAALVVVELLRALDQFQLPLSAWASVARGYLTLRSLLPLADYWLVIVAIVLADFYASIRSGERQARQLRQQLATVQLNALRTKLQPHFLFNTFNSIASLVRTGRTDEAVTMITDISELLRLGLDHQDKPEVDLRTELLMAECYLNIEQARFRDRLTVRLAIESDTLDATVPNLIIQPLVENAIKHGISPSDRPGTVEIFARRVGDELELVVANTRPTSGRGRPDTPSLGIGLSTTRERIERSFGAAGECVVEDADPGKFRVIVRLPFRPVPGGAAGETNPRGPMSAS